MTEKELYNEYRSCNCKSFTDYLINKIAELKKQLVEKGQLLDLTEREWAKDTTKLIHFKTQLTKAKELLERLLITSCNSDVLNLLPNCSEVLRVREEAEQFLNEVEK